jgi:hypothetical protein
MVSRLFNDNVSASKSIQHQIISENDYPWWRTWEESDCDLFQSTIMEKLKKPLKPRLEYAVIRQTIQLGTSQIQIYTYIFGNVWLKSSKK